MEDTQKWARRIGVSMTWDSDGDDSDGGHAPFIDQKIEVSNVPSASKYTDVLVVARPGKPQARIHKI